MTGTTCAPNPGHQARGPGGEAVEWRGVRMLLPVLKLTLSCGHIPRPLACWPSYSDGALPADLLSSFTSGPSSGRCLRSYQEIPPARGTLLPLLSWTCSLCNDSPSLARLVDLRQSKKGRPAELGLHYTHTEKGVMDLGSSRPQPFCPLFLPWGLSLIWNYILGQS